MCTLDIIQFAHIETFLSPTSDQFCTLAHMSENPVLTIIPETACFYFSIACEWREALEESEFKH